MPTVPEQRRDEAEQVRPHYAPDRRHPQHHKSSDHTPTDGPPHPEYPVLNLASLCGNTARTANWITSIRA
ncbi:hypothetical protein GC163_14200 [bacterium]|nr:hypothetical protein [bacterium]